MWHELKRHLDTLIPLSVKMFTYLHSLLSSMEYDIVDYNIPENYDTAPVCILSVSMFLE